MTIGQYLAKTLEENPRAICVWDEAAGLFQVTGQANSTLSSALKSMARVPNQFVKWGEHLLALEATALGQQKNPRHEISSTSAKLRLTNVAERDRFSFGGRGPGNISTLVFPPAPRSAKCSPVPEGAPFFPRAPYTPRIR
jgi:hypothetical protein